jgi:pimeloyl-ACP methyl ester carboxylesterase
MSRRRMLYPAVLLALLLSAPAAAQTELQPGYGDRPLRGASSSKGAVIYSHGVAAVAETSPELPYVLDALQESGWDVFRLQRRWAGETLPSSTAALAESVQKLRGEGYGKVVLAGQSFGAWISLIVAAQPGQVHAIVALAPAAFGTRDRSPAWTRNADGLYPLAESLVAARTLVFFFEGDDYDPGGRGERLREIFGRRGLAAAVVDRPAGFLGHSVGLTRGFARRFAPCVRDYVEAASPPPRFTCDDEPTASALRDLPLPATSRIMAAPANAPPALSGMLGRWYGVYPSGREVLFVVEEVGRDRARAIYSFGPVARHFESRAGYTARRGEFDAATGLLSFSEPQASSNLQAKLAPDGRLDFSWTNRQTGGRLSARLRKLD